MYNLKENSSNFKVATCDTVIRISKRIKSCCATCDPHGAVPCNVNTQLKKNHTESNPIDTVIRISEGIGSSAAGDPHGAVPCHCITPCNILTQYHNRKCMIII